VIDLPQRLSPYVSDKGSIAVDGISLTVNRLRDHDTGVSISINIIPHTWQMTQLHQRRPGDRVNIEVDQLAKQVARMLPRLAQISADPLPSETY
jgi:riboflavin synthase